jgi:hypothetical protein
MKGNEGNEGHARRAVEDSQKKDPRIAYKTNSRMRGGRGG